MYTTFFFFVLILILIYSPSGCTFWGKKPWSRKKKILWQLGTLVGAPVGIGLVAGIAVPAMIIGNYFETLSILHKEIKIKGNISGFRSFNPFVISDL